MVESFAYFRGEATYGLWLMMTKLYDMWTGRDTGLSRSSELDRRYRDYQVFRGVDGVYIDICAKLDGKPLLLSPNDYPHDAILPEGAEEYVLWSGEEELTTEVIDQVVEENFAGLSVLVFRQDLRRRSIKERDHVHIVVDRRGDANRQI